MQYNVRSKNDDKFNMGLFCCNVKNQSVLQYNNKTIETFIISLLGEMQYLQFLLVYQEFLMNREISRNYRS